MSCDQSGHLLGEECQICNSTLIDTDENFGGIISTFYEGVRRRHAAATERSSSIVSSETSFDTDFPAILEVKHLLEVDDYDFEEDCYGCPLPSTPVNPSLFEAEIREALREGNIDLGTMVNAAREPAEIFVRKVWEASWSVCEFAHLPSWLQDNDYLHDGHRPPLPSFSACFKSIFRIHTETGNIWTHLLGCIAFVGMMGYFMIRPQEELTLTDKLAFGVFFISVIVCLGFSFAFHTVCCHSEYVGKLFSKLDYCGISVLITGSFIPWLYYSFYCDVYFLHRIVYMTTVIVLGMLCMIVSLWDRFSESRFRTFRACLFVVFGLSGVIPAIHYCIVEGWLNALSYASLGWLILMGSLYILGALLYASRVPERFFPGKFDIWFQSHQIFHFIVFVAACIHYHSITEMASYRFSVSTCMAQTAAVIL